MKYALALFVSLFCYSCCNRKMDNAQWVQNCATDSVKTMKRLTKNSNIQAETITMSCLQPVYCFPLTKIEVCISNNSKKDIITGVGYSIEYYDENKWVEVPLHYAFVEIAIGILVGESKNFTIDLQASKHSYKEGKYRIAKNIREDNKKYIYYAQFSISE